MCSYVVRGIKFNENVLCFVKHFYLDLIIARKMVNGDAKDAKLVDFSMGAAHLVNPDAQTIF